MRVGSSFVRRRSQTAIALENWQLGTKIVAKAGGLPLAILVLGGLLSTKQKTHSVWQKILESATWHLSESSKQCLQVLALSYNDLPYYLKSCFLYFGMYPEDVYIEADRLIRLWISEGFIQVRGEETMEDVAEDCLEELVQRSMVQVAKRRDDGIIESCRIHDLLRDLAILEAKKGRFLEIYESHCSIEACRPRRLANHFGKGTLDTNLKYTAENLRSFLCFSHEGPEKNIWASFFGRVKLLRVLDLCSIYNVELPEEIGKLIHLKYLAASGNSDIPLKVPTSIENLINLQTLDLKESTIETPNMLRNMHHLRHLFCGSIHPEDNTHESNPIDHLRDLQTLEVKYSTWMDGFEKVTSLRRLSISMDLEEHSKLSNSLANFQRLRSLSLPNFSSSTLVPLVSFSLHMHLTEMRLETLQKIPDKEDFPPNLVYLKIFRLQPEESVDPMATLEKLPNLRTLEIHSGFYIGRRITCSRGGFANLQHLAMSHLHGLEEWIVKEGAMPNLRSLYMRRCHELEVISDSLKHISTLKDVRFVRMKEIRSWWEEPATGHHGSGDGGGSI